MYNCKIRSRASESAVPECVESSASNHNQLRKTPGISGVVEADGSPEKQKISQDTFDVWLLLFTILGILSYKRSSGMLQYLCARAASDSNLFENANTVDLLPSKEFTGAEAFLLSFIYIFRLFPSLNSFPKALSRPHFPLHSCFLPTRSPVG